MKNIKGRPLTVTATTITLVGIGLIVVGILWAILRLFGGALTTILVGGTVAFIGTLFGIFAVSREKS